MIVTTNYRPDGWLNRLISGKISIDFTKLDFEMAQMKLKTEIVIVKKNITSIEFQSKSKKKFHFRIFENLFYFI